MRPIRSWAASLLDRWISRPEAQVLPLYEKAGLGLDVLPETSQSSNESHSVPEILYHTGEIAQDFQELKDALIASTDHDRIFSALDKIETWEAEPLSAQSFQKTLFGLTMAHRHPAKEVTDRLYGSRKFSIPTHIQRQVTGFSYYTPAEETTFQLTFRDKNSLPNTYRSMRLPREEPDERIWADVTVETTSTSPIDVLFGQFIAMSNSRHQHPLAPLSGFSFASASSFVGKTNEEVAKIRNSTWKVRPGRFVQGQVKDLLVTESKVVYYSRSNFSRDSVSDLTLKPPQQRTLPPSCVAPQHWIRPAMPPGGEAVWECLPSLAFVGNGHDLYPGATSPPAITSHIYVPRAFDRERLGIYPHAAYQREVTKDATPVKLEPPITAAQAAALLGRAIQFEVPVVPLPPLPPNARPKKRRREPPPPIYWGVVWGVDAAALELRIFTGGQYQEASATLKVGQPCAVPSNPIDMTRPFTPKWVGLLSLVDGAPEETVPAPAPEAGPTVDRLLSILAVAARSPQFEVGIDGDCVVIAGEISLHGIDSPSVEKIDGCKSGIWQGAREPAGTDQFSMWVRWVRDGTIDLTQPVERFVVTPEGDGDAAALQWTPLTTVTADGGKMALLARGLTSPESIFALTGNDDGDVAGFVECIVLYGAEEDSFHIPGGVSSYTGGDGSFDVLTASDSDGKVVGIKITVSQ
ncbi:hypothetical protein DFH07DRAFT_264830 [Mycena maculata]|uniref:Uncharacterized protein n=1 Tax=Mycena maculata TaxID=230809 RepID=A0AAD7HPH4_9AGAR|nr:hypothetical protein DFH07DRAFT_264830 [Mycena maculata]